MYWQKNTSLESLALERNHIARAGGEAIASALTVNDTLSSLSIANNSIGDKAAQKLAIDFSVNKGLTALNIENIGMEEAGTLALGEALATNNTLQTVCSIFITPDKNGSNHCPFFSSQCHGTRWVKLEV